MPRKNRNALAVGKRQQHTTGCTCRHCRARRDQQRKVRSRG